MQPQSFPLDRCIREILDVRAWSLLIYNLLTVGYPLLIFIYLELKELLELRCIRTQRSHLLYFERLVAVALQPNESEHHIADIRPNELLNCLRGPCLLQCADAVAYDAFACDLHNHSVHIRHNREVWLGVNAEEAKS